MRSAHRAELEQEWGGGGWRGVLYLGGQGGLGRILAGEGGDGIRGARRGGAACGLRMCRWGPIGACGGAGGRGGGGGGGLGGGGGRRGASIIFGPSACGAFSCRDVGGRRVIRRGGVKDVVGGRHEGVRIC